MMCHRIGMPPISTIGLGRISVSSERREPRPPAKIATFIVGLSKKWLTPPEHAERRARAMPLQLYRPDTDWRRMSPKPSPQTLTTRQIVRRRDTEAGAPRYFCV